MWTNNRCNISQKMDENKVDTGINTEAAISIWESSVTKNLNNDETKKKIFKDLFQADFDLVAISQFYQ